jgi:hypothetical protein
VGSPRDNDRDKTNCGEEPDHEIDKPKFFMKIP